MVAFERFSCSLSISEIALPSGTIIFVLFCKDAEIVSSCLNVMALSLKYVVKASFLSRGCLGVAFSYCDGCGFLSFSLKNRRLFLSFCNLNRSVFLSACQGCLCYGGFLGCLAIVVCFEHGFHGYDEFSWRFKVFDFCTYDFDAPSSLFARQELF